MEYEVTIVETEKYTVRVDANTECDAIAKAFDRRYSWTYASDGDTYEVSAKEVDA